MRIGSKSKIYKDSDGSWKLVLVARSRWDIFTRPTFKEVVGILAKAATS